MLDRIGAKRPVVLGCVLGAVGFYLWAGKVTGLSFGAQQWDIILAGAGMGLMLGPATTDAVNRASRLSYGEATGITQTVRNYAASLGLAILGTILVSQMRSRVTTSLISLGVPSARAHSRASSISQSQGNSGSVAADSPLRAARLRLCDALGAVRDGGDHGRGSGRGVRRPARGAAGGDGPRGGRRRRRRSPGLEQTRGAGARLGAVHRSPELGWPSMTCARFRAAYRAASRSVLADLRRLHDGDGVHPTRSSLPFHVHTDPHGACLTPRVLHPPTCLSCSASPAISPR